jgi:hypothetical protein
VCCVLMHDAKMPTLKQLACSTNYCFKELHINETASRVTPGFSLMACFLTHTG